MDVGSMLKTIADKVRSGFRDYTGGVGLREAQESISRDAGRAYGILTREHAGKPVPEGRFRRAWFRTKILYLGLTRKLTPPRRLLFVVCLVVTFLGIQQPDNRSGHILLLAAVAGLVLLVILELADRVVVRDELEVARDLQRRLLPESAPDIPGYSFAHSYQSANTIGGDYYDFVVLPDGRLVLAAGDASGHGIAAGLLMAIAQAAFRFAVDLNPDPAEVASMMNRVLLRSGGRHGFLTLFCAILDPESGRLDYICAGHPFPLLRREDGSIDELGTGSFPLGIRADLPLEIATTEMQRGELLVMVSDGIPEAVNASGEAFGFERLRALVREGGRPSAVHGRIMDEFSRFMGDERPQDDRTLVVLARTRARD